MFKSNSERNVVYKCSVRLFGDSEILEMEFQVNKIQFLLIFPWYKLLILKFKGYERKKFRREKEKKLVFFLFSYNYSILTRINETLYCSHELKMLFDFLSQKSLL
jgi:hypothetical protein